MGGAADGARPRRTAAPRRDGGGGATASARTGDRAATAIPTAG
jgi:hypothetical protein